MKHRTQGAHDTDRAPITNRMALAVFDALTGYMGRAGLILYAEAPAAAPSPAPAAAAAPSPAPAPGATGDAAAPAAAPAAPAAVGNIIAESAAPAAAAPAAPTVDEMRAALTTAGGKADELAKLSEADLKTQHDALVAKTAAAPAAPTKDAQIAHLVAKGAKAEDLAKLDDAALKKQYDEQLVKDGTAPLEYKDFKLPEGVKLTEKGIQEFQALAAKHRMPQDAAEAMLAMHAAEVKAVADAPYALWRQQQAEWQSTVMKDPEIGGPKFETVTKPLIAKAISAIVPDATQSKALLEAFNFTGAGNHPEMVRFMTRIGKMVSEGTIVPGPKPGEAGQKSTAEKLYPTHQAPATQTA